MHTRQRTLLALLILLSVFVPGVSGQESDTMQELAFLEGSWDVVGQVETAAGEWADFSGYATFHWDVDGAFLRQDLTGIVNDQRMQALNVWAYNPFISRFNTIWTDTQVINSIPLMAGNFQGDQLVALTRFAGEGVQLTLTQDGEDSFDLVLARGPSITSIPEDVLRLTYTRRAENNIPADAFESAELPPPPAEMQQFAFWIGDWDIQSRLRPNEEEEWVESPATQTVQWTLGGYAIEDYWQGDFFEGPNTIWGLTRYNPTTQHWERVIAQANDGGMGTLGDGVCQEDGSCQIGGDQFFDFRDDGFSWAHDHGDPPTNRIWEMDYTRRSE